VTVLTASCATNSIKPSSVSGPEGAAEGQWHGKALVKNLKTAKSATLTLEILAKEPSQMRMDITGSFGVAVATIVLDGHEVRYLLPREKRFVIAPAASDALGHLIPLKISPQVLLALLFDRRFPAADWKCIEVVSQPGVYDECKHLRESLFVKWIDRNGRSRRLKVGTSDAEAEMVLDEVKSKVEVGPDTFKLNAPSGYKQEKL
jgi:hypothetical protein